MKRSHLILLSSSLFGLAGCTWALGMLGYDPGMTAKIHANANRGAEAGADIMEAVLEFAKLALIYFGGMLTVPGTKMGAKATMAGARKVKKMMGEKPKAKPK